MMKNFLKQFGGWDTALEFKISNIFRSARFRITTLYFLCGLIILFLSGAIVDSYASRFLEEELMIVTGSRAGGIIEAARITNEMEFVVWSVRIVMMVVLAMVTYFLAGATLTPIRRIVDAQRRFIANASHELRTPLAIIKTNSEVALATREGITREEAISTMKGNIEEIDRMANALQVLLSFSGYQNSPKLPLIRIDLIRGVRRVIRFLSPQAKSRGVRIALIAPELVYVRGNAPALEELITNIVKNAINYTPRDKTVEIQVQEKGHHILLRIHDPGVGILPEDLPHIFEPFYRGGNRNAEGKMEGVGLGLAIAHEVAVLHRTLIHVESAPHKGTTFSLELPAA